MRALSLLEETKIAIKNSGHKIDDIQFIGSADGYSCTWSEFVDIADIEYDSSFGSACVATDLRVIFNDGQTMWRGEYDGSEWWEYLDPFVIPDEIKPIKCLVGQYWPNLKDLQDDTDAHHNPELLGATNDKN